MITSTDTIDIDIQLIRSECCGADVNLTTVTCTKCKKECDWGINVDDCDTRKRANK
jgi:hypothetical protein